MAYAGERFVNALLKGLKGEKSVQCTFIKSDAVPGVEYFSTPVELGVSALFKVDHSFVKRRYFSAEWR
jgi:malate dehydrogenase